MTFICSCSNLFKPTLNECFYGYLKKICSWLTQVATRERKPRGIIRICSVNLLHKGALAVWNHSSSWLTRCRRETLEMSRDQALKPSRRSTLLLLFLRLLLVTEAGEVTLDTCMPGGKLACVSVHNKPPVQKWTKSWYKYLNWIKLDLNCM